MQSVDGWYQNIINSVHSNFARNIYIKKTSSKSYHVRLKGSVYFSCLTTEQPHAFSKEVKLMEETSSATKRDASVLSGLPQWEFGFLHENGGLCLVLVNAPTRV